MPTYEYRCESCGHTFERHEHVAEHAAHQTSPIPCPKCGHAKTTPVMSGFFAKTNKKS
jgi:putative FmdB family regulatory protein